MSSAAAEVELIEIQKADGLSAECPSEELLIQWARAGAEVETGVDTDSAAGMTLRIVGREEIHQSNQQWRGVDKPTNVLSFPAEFPPEAGVRYLGDILICAEVLERERLELGKTLNEHWAHIVVHGVLHLRGFDHENDQEAQVMEQREREILSTLGIDNPYRDDVP